MGVSETCAVTCVAIQATYGDARFGQCNKKAPPGNPAGLEQKPGI